MIQDNRRGQVLAGVVLTENAGIPSQVDEMEIGQDNVKILKPLQEGGGPILHYKHSI